MLQSFVEEVREQYEYVGRCRLTDLGTHVLGKLDAFWHIMTKCPVEPEFLDIGEYSRFVDNG